MASIDETIAALENRLKQAKAKKQQAEARKRAAEQKKTRAEDTRRKVLVGAAILARVERGEMAESDLADIMGRFLTRPDDRALFDLDKSPAADTRGQDD
jgi:hypothetical protein